MSDISQPSAFPRISDEEWASRLYDAGFYYCSNDPKIIVGGTKSDDKILCHCGQIHVRCRLQKATATEFVAFEKALNTRTK
jgi:hypothetical protein